MDHSPFLKPNIITMIATFRIKNVLPLFFMLLFALVVVGCNNRKTVERLPADQIAAEPEEPLLEPEPIGAGSNLGLVLNPAHGQPGHRCDVKVGAPLNGAVPTNTPSVFEPVNQAAVVTNSPTLNPAHGQPGHRCDVPVGSPL